MNTFGENKRSYMLSSVPLISLEMRRIDKIKGGFVSDINKLGTMVKQLRDRRRIPIKIVDLSHKTFSDDRLNDTLEQPY